MSDIAVRLAATARRRHRGDDVRAPVRRVRKEPMMIRKLANGQYRLYSRKADPKTGKRRNLGTFDTREQAEKHERAVQYFKHHG
jgi:hypothetical protein